MTGSAGHKLKLARSLSVIALMLVTNACATIICGTTQDITVNSVPSDCRVTVSYHKIQKVDRRYYGGYYKPTKAIDQAIALDVDRNTPTIVTLPRWARSVRIRVEKEGFNPQNIMLVRRINGFVFLNIVLGGVVGIGVDLATGAAYTLQPEYIDVVLTETKQQGKVLSTPSGTDVLVLPVTSPKCTGH